MAPALSLRHYWLLSARRNAYRVQMCCAWMVRPFAMTRAHIITRGGRGGKVVGRVGGGLLYHRVRGRAWFAAIQRPTGSTSCFAGL
jgi:hypothetical protein